LLVAVSLVWACSSPTDSSTTAAATTATATVTSAAVVVAAPSLGTAASLAILGGSAGITNSGVVTVITGNIATTGVATKITGLHQDTTVDSYVPTTSSYTETNLNVGAVGGIIYADAPAPGSAANLVVATAALSDAQVAYDYLVARPSGKNVGADLSGLTLSAGVYTSSAANYLLAGDTDLTLDAKGNADAVWIFQMTGQLVVGAAAQERSVILKNGAQAKNVYWQVGSNATINPSGGGTFVGTIIAYAGIAFSTADNVTITTLNGRALSLTGPVTLVNTIITEPDMPRSHRIFIGATYKTVKSTISGTGYVYAINNGSGTITANENGSGTITIIGVSSGGDVTATNADGTLTINNADSGAVTVTNNGTGNVIENASGSNPITHTYDLNVDITYTN